MGGLKKWHFDYPSAGHVYISSLSCYRINPGRISGRERDKKKENKKKEAEEYGNADVDGGQRGQLVPLAVAVGKHEKPLTVDMGVQCNIIDDASCHSCQKTEEKYLNEIYQLSGWVARHCFRMFLCIPMFQDY